MLKTTKITDPEVYSIVADELERQKYNIEMIASERRSSRKKISSRFTTCR